MKKGGTFLMIGLTLLFLGFTAGMLVGRALNRHEVTIQVPTNTEQTKSGTHLHSVPQATQDSQNQLININTASAALLDSLPGIGQVLAQRIVDYRDANGPFSDVAELSNVEGIGDEKLLAILEYITVEE